jgi:solute carrier family 36 (proton-coupled amino acid transporter)
MSKFVLFTCWTGVCVVFVILVSSNMKHVVDFYTQSHIDLIIYIVILWPFFVALILVKHLKFVAIYSLLAELLDVVAFAITISFFFEGGGTPRISDRELAKSVLEAPKFFAIAIFAIQAIGVVCIF